MPKKSTKEKPDYVMEFEKTKPKNTEIKNFGDNWYLYERYNYYDKIEKKPKKISGPMIGTITPNGLIPCLRRKKGRGHMTLYQQYMSERKQRDTTSIVSGDNTVSESDPPCEDKSSQENYNCQEIQERIAVQDDSVIQGILGPQDGPEVPEPQGDLVAPKSQDGPEVPEPQGDLVAPESQDGPEAPEPQGDLVAPESQDSSETQNSLLSQEYLNEHTIFAALEATIPDVVPSESVEFGMELYCFQRTSVMREKLKIYFGASWPYIYVIALLRLIYGPRFRRIATNYYGSILSHLYPGLHLYKENLCKILYGIGAHRGSIINYMRDSVHSENNILLVDGHRIISSSKTLSNAEQGYDSKQRHKRQINLMYVVSGDNGSLKMPLYYKQYNGGTLDLHAVRDLFEEIGQFQGKLTVIADKGCLLDEECDSLRQKGVHYISPLKRGNRFVNGQVPAANSPNWDGFFNYNGRCVQYKVFNTDDESIYLYFDCNLFAEEMASISGRTDGENEKKLAKLQNLLESRKKKLESAKSKFIKVNEQLEKVNTRLQIALDRASNSFQTKSRGNAEAIQRRIDKVLDLIVKESARVQAKKNELYEAYDNVMKAKDSIEAAEIIIEATAQFYESGKFSLDPSAVLDSAIDTLYPTTMEESLKKSGNEGTITLRTSRKDLSVYETYELYKTRDSIEKYFNTYDDTFDFDASYMRSKLSIEGWLFLNHLAAEMGVDILTEISLRGMSKTLSLEDLICAFRKINATYTEGKWLVPHIKNAIQSLCFELDYDPEELLNSFDWNKIEAIRNKIYNN